MVSGQATNGLRTVIWPGETAATAPAGRAPIELFTPTAVGVTAFLCGIPAGLVLAAINHRRMGDGDKARTFLAGAAAVLAVVVFSALALGSFGGLLNLAIGIGGLVFLVRDARESAEGYRVTDVAYDANGFLGFLLGLGVAIGSVAVFFGIAGMLAG